MISLQICDSPDLLSIGTHQFHLHHITLGRSLGNTIPVNDRDCEKKHLDLKLNKNGLFLFSNHSYLHNSKFVSGNIKLAISDEIDIGQTKIKILNFDIKNALDENEYSDTVEKISNSDPKLSAVFDALEEVFIDITSDDYNELEN